MSFLLNQISIFPLFAIENETFPIPLLTENLGSSWDMEFHIPDMEVSVFKRQRQLNENRQCGIR